MIHNEARGEGREAMVAVGWTLRNRMLRNGVARVDQAWGGYNHNTPQIKGPEDRASNAVAREVAEGILNGSIADPTSGATHYYSPKSMPKLGEATHGDVSGGLESVEGVNDRNGKPTPNYKPGYLSSLQFVPTPGIMDRDYKFYRQSEGKSHVR